MNCALYKQSRTLARCVFAALPLSLASAPPAQAAEPWEFTLTTYLWAAGIDGDVGTFPALPPVSVDVSFGDIMDNFKFGAMALMEARKDRFLLLADFIYLDIGTSKDVSIPDAQFSEVRFDNKNIMSTMAVGYRVADASATKFDVLAGIRINAVDTSVDLLRPNGTGLSADSDEAWVDPIFGARLRTPLGKKTTFALYGDLGGFGVSSDFTWQAAATLQYQVSEHVVLSGGYRMLGVDYENDGYVFDVTMSGPMLGASYRF